jgi:hypothetical protein
MDSGATEEVAFDVHKQSGNYDIDVNGLKARFVVKGPSSASPVVFSWSVLAEIIGITLILIAATIGVILLIRRRLLQS